jgi:hypothetical protein
MSYNFSPKIVSDGLLMYLDAANTKSYISGFTYFNDLTKNNTNGTLINNPTYTPLNGGGITFDGINEYVELINNQNSSFTNFSEVTIDVWVNINSFFGIGNRFIYAQFFTGGNTSCGIFLNTSGKFVFGYRDNVQNNSGSIKSVTSISTLLTNKIYNLVVTFKANTITKLFINGVVDNSSIQNNNISSLNPDFIRIARLNNPTADFYNGKIYSIKIYDRALSETEITQNYNALKTRFGL